MKTKRNINIDLIKGIAVISVVIGHSINDIYNISGTEYLALSNQTKFFNSFFTILTSIGVPFFLISTGFFMYRKEKSVIEIIKQKVLPLWIGFTFWESINWLLLKNKPYEIKEFIKEILFLKSSYPRYLWYIPSLIGIYLISPLIINGISNFKKRHFKYLFILVLYSSIIYSLSFFDTLLELDGISSSLDLNLIASIPLLYTISGYYFFKYAQYKKSNTKKNILLLLTFISLVMIHFILMENRGTRIYNHTLGIIFTLLFFNFLYHINIPNKYHNLLINFSRKTLGIYFIHRPVLYLIDEKFDFIFINKPVSVIMLSLFAIGISLVIQLSLQKLNLKYII